ncbi:MAG: biotin--[acetyl-CoA-carboxylase] ligase [Muribaculaceae bacterium]
MPRYILVRETESTNTYLARMASMLPSGTVIYTMRQTAGRGQRGNSWESEPDKNLAFSMLIKNPPVLPAKQFLISEAASLAITHELNAIVDGFKIKWPNDIYYGNSKVAGILIEHTLTSKAIGQTIIGIGLNVNQTEFRSDAPNPISLKQITGNDFDPKQLLERICTRIEQNVERLALSPDACVDTHSQYLGQLYRNDGKTHSFALPDGTRLEASISDVKPDGMLCLRIGDEVREFAFKEVSFIV